MTNRIYFLNGVRYLSTGQTATKLKVDQRTVMRWVKRITEGTAPQPLVTLVWVRDPTNNFTYFREYTVLALKKQLEIFRPTRIRR